MLTKDNRFRVLRTFFDYPEKEFHIRELARITKLSPPGIMKIVKSLEKEHLLISKKGNIITSIHASKSEKFLQLKRFINLYNIYECGFIEFLIDEFSPNAIVLFGSYAKGDDISTSDVDIFVLAKEKEIELKRYEIILKRKINILFESDIKTVPKELLNNIINGVVVYGYLKVF